MTTRPFKIEVGSDHPIRDSVARASRPIVERALRFGPLNDVYDAIMSHPNQDASFSERALDVLGIQLDLIKDQLENIPKAGPVVVVANHPFGGIEGLILCHLLKSVRPDSMMMATTLLEMIPGLRKEFFFVDNFESDDAVKRNLAATRQAMRWVKDGHMLGVFPAGEVSSLKLRKRSVIDPTWNPIIARIIKKTGATAVPIYFDGRNSKLFQAAGLIHPRLRSVMLPTELLRKRNDTIPVRIGKPIPAKRMERFEDPVNLSDYLRVRTYLLKPQAAPPTPTSLSEENLKPLHPPIPVDELLEDFAAMPKQALLLSQGEYDVYYTMAAQSPRIMREIARLRELTFREVGEGTGTELDTDRFDPHYIQLIVWHRDNQQLVGGYRLGPSDEILKAHGKEGLYTATLFKFRKNLLDQINPALELGRSWVAPDYQRSYAPLMLLWKGIGAYISLNPRYRYLFGPVSISAQYTSMSKHLLLSFLTRNRFLPDLGKLIRPRNPMKLTDSKRFDRKAFSTVAGSLEEINELLSELEADGKPMPILLKQYLKLNGQLMGFNVDPDFGDVLDGLILIDLLKVDRRVMDKYFGKEACKAYLANHGVE